MLDELTTGLDPAARRDTWAVIQAVRERGVTVLLVTHAMEEAERLCDRVAVVDAGRVVALGTPDALSATWTPARSSASARSAPLDDRCGRRAPAGLRGPPGGRRGRRRRQRRRAGRGHRAARTQRHLPQRLRVEQATLEDAFVALTGRVPDADSEEVPA